MIEAPMLDPKNVLFLLIDVQTRFLKSMSGDKTKMLKRLGQFCRLAQWLEIPLIATLEHPTAKKGELPPKLASMFPKHGQKIIKRHFSCWKEEEIRSAIRKTGAKQIVLAGSETDVCVLQTALDLASCDYKVHLLEDCVFSSTRDCSSALKRMLQAGVVPMSCKTLLYELQGKIEEALPDELRAKKRALKIVES